ncbi:MAG: DNA photolyase family protein [Parachlamydia sp.]|nr:DNA photolyase family protein [Parachlamydia sp.]
MQISIVWFRHDLRIHDQPALAAALALNGPVIPLFIWSPEEERNWPQGAASRWWLHYSLMALQEDLRSLGLNLIIRKGKSLQQLQTVIQETDARHLYWNRRYEPWAIQRDAAIKATLRDQDIEVHSFNSHLLFEPWTISNKQGRPFQVFTPFWNNCLTKSVSSPLPPPCPCSKPAPKIDSLTMQELDLLPHIAWDDGLKKAWKPGNAGAEALLQRFLQEPILHYAQNRDRPDLEGVSRLSPHLHFGEVSPRMIWHSVKKLYPKGAGDSYLRQLGWREFAHHLLFHFPNTVDTPLQSKYAAFPWLQNKDCLHAWQKGQTGYPIVDAGMRELWTTGWMHNRVRMIVGSFLVKDLLIDWQEGERWFWDTLVDADMANNTLGWQWVAGCGADAAPYFRIFNPVLQGEKFDPQGHYVKRWVPELAHLPLRWLHKPWKAPEDVLKTSGISIGNNYPKPIVDHDVARMRALAALKTIKESHV